MVCVPRHGESQIIDHPTPSFTQCHFWRNWMGVRNGIIRRGISSTHYIDTVCVTRCLIWTVNILSIKWLSRAKSLTFFRWHWYVFFHASNWMLCKISLKIVPDGPIDQSHKSHMHLSHIPQCTTQNRNVHALWDIGQVNYASVLYPTKHHSVQKCTHFCYGWCIVGYRTGGTVVFVRLVYWK